MKIEQTASQSGLCTTMAYDPYYARAVEGLKRILLDGHPIMMRLHAGADYEMPDGDLHGVDLEGQAVLVTGYDDETREFIVQDPWSRDLGTGPSGRRRMGYWELSYRMVNASRGYAAVVSPPMMTVTTVEKGGHTELGISVGLYTPDMCLMDVATSWLENVTIDVAGTHGMELLGDTRSAKFDGPLGHGEIARFCIRARIESASPELSVTIGADYVAERPYKFREPLQTRASVRDFALSPLVVPLVASM